MPGVSRLPAVEEAQQGAGLHQGGEDQKYHVEDPIFQPRPESQDLRVSDLQEEHQHRERLSTFQTQLSSCLI